MVSAYDACLLGPLGGNIESLVPFFKTTENEETFNRIVATTDYSIKQKQKVEIKLYIYNNTFCVMPLKAVLATGHIILCDGLSSVARQLAIYSIDFFTRTNSGMLLILQM